MPSLDLLSHQIALSIAKCQNTLTLQPVEIGQGSWQNELVLFIKPEIFLAENVESIEKAVRLVFDKLNEFEVYPHGIMIVGGKVLEENEIMNQHYGFINRLSRFASTMMNESDRQKIAEALGLPQQPGLPDLNGYAIYGGHEFLDHYPDEDIYSLDQLWFTKKSLKMRSGFYLQSYEKDGDKIILVNGFHPAQLAHFTDPSHRIVLMLAHSNSGWSQLKNEMVGATFPERAVSGSIRGILYANPQEYGLQSVSIANNGVHLSAGPFEAGFEIVNFFGKITGFNLDQNPPLAFRQMMAAGFTPSQSLNTLRNPILDTPGKPTDLFTATEDMDTQTAIHWWRENLSKVIGYSRE
jgi:hypothetical protein